MTEFRVTALDIRGYQRRANLKGFVTLVLLIGFTLMMASCLTYYHSRLTRYEAEISTLEESIQDASKEIRLRKRRDVTNAERAERSHRLVKRDALQGNNSQLGLQQNQDNPMMGHGTAYTRWGRRDCSGPNTKMLYTGLAAITHYSHTGGGSNFLCLDINVDYTKGRYVEGFQGSSHIYGVEYRDSTWINSLFNVGESTESQNLYLHSVPCTLCMARQKTSHVMMVGRGNCPDNWQLEYRGFIMAGNHGDKHPSEFICVDENPQVVPGTHGDQKGGFLHMVETQCASLLCEPFVAGRELQCVVCSI